jgi:hypothetical protein
MKKLNLFIFMLFMFLSLSFAQEKAKEGPKSPQQVITKQAIQERIDKLQKSREQAIANVNAYDGAIQEAQYWLSLFTETEEIKQAPDKK